MGTWNLEQNIGVTGTPDTMIHFNGQLYLSIRDGRIYRRVGTTWNLVRNVPALYPQNCVEWQGRLWTFDDDEIFSSADGTTWVVDVDLRALNGDVTYTIETINCNHTKLFASGVRSPAGATYFYERDTLGNWTLSPPTSPGAGILTDDFIEWGNYYYYSLSGTQFYRWTGSAWQAVPGVVAQPGWCTVQGNVMWVKLHDPALGTWVYWVDPNTDVWTQNFSIGATWSHGSRISFDQNNRAWFAISDGFATRVYYRHLASDPSSSWIRLSLTGVATDGRVAGAYDEDTIFFVTRTNNVVYLWVTSSWSVHPAGLDPQAMDCDGDGDMLYICVYNNAGNFPHLITVGLPLDGAASVGLSKFDPLAGTAINVRCPVVGDSAVISGDFGVNEQVETSDSSGTVWTDIDRDAWGAETAQPLVVDPLTMDEVMVALAAAQDITETFDAGATAWVVNNAAVGYSPGAMAKLVNGDEMILGDDAANRIDYSPNRGVSTANVTGAFVGNVAALEMT